MNVEPARPCTFACFGEARLLNRPKSPLEGIGDIRRLELLIDAIVDAHRSAVLIHQNLNKNTTAAANHNRQLVALR
jgi:hypothetical protein